MKYKIKNSTLPFDKVLLVFLAIVSWTCCRTRWFRSPGLILLADPGVGSAGRARLEEASRKESCAGMADLKKPSSIVNKFVLSVSRPPRFNHTGNVPE